MISEDKCEKCHETFPDDFYKTYAKYGYKRPVAFRGHERIGVLCDSCYEKFRFNKPAWNKIKPISQS